MKPLMWLALTIPLFIGGCTSFCHVVSVPEPESDPNLRSAAGMFYIADVHLKSNAISPQAALKDEQLQQRFLPMLRKECLARYPALFSETATGSIPLLVEAELLKYSLSPIKVSGLMYSYNLEEESCIKVSVWTGQKNLRGETMQTKTSRKEHTRKRTDLTVNVTAIEDSELRQRAPQGATAIAKLIISTDSAVWTAEPHWVEFQESRATPSAGTPASLPLPAGTVAPF